MAFFKFRKGGDGSQAAPPQPESVEGLRRRARHRLIGAAVLVLLGVVGFPLLFDTQPRPVAVDIPIEIPDRSKAKPLPAPAAAESRSSAPVVASQAAAAAAAGTPSKAPTSAGPVTLAVPEPPKAVTPPPARAEPKPEARPAEAKAATPAPNAAASSPVAKAASAPAVDGARAQALLEGKPVQAVAQEAASGRFVVQVGAFGEAGKAREAQMKLERAGLKNYTHEAETKDGKRIRVRAGPFPTRAEADKAAGKIKELNLPTQILAL